MSKGEALDTKCPPLGEGVLIRGKKWGQFKVSVKQKSTEKPKKKKQMKGMEEATA